MIVAAVGLELRDLFPESLNHHNPAIRDYRHVHAAREALRLLSEESLVVLVAAQNLAQGITLTDDDGERLALAATRIRAAREVAA